MDADALERLTELLRLLSLEQREVASRLEATWADGRDKELESAGVLLRGALIAEAKPAILGRTRARLEEDPSRPGHIEEFAVRPGSVVYVRRKEDDGSITTTVSGVVVRRSARALTVVFDQAANDLRERVDLVRGEDDVTLRRMKEGVAACQRAEGRAGQLVETVLGVRSPKPVKVGALTLLDEALHDDQRRATEIGVFAEDVGLVHGPPGTGKTRVLVEIVRQCVARGERVLCLCASNAAIDHLALSVLHADPELMLARVGHPARVHEDLEAITIAALTDAHELRQLARGLIDEAFRLLSGARRRSDTGREAWRREREARVEAGRRFADARRLERQAVEEVLRTRRVLCGTLTGFARDLGDDQHFDVLVVDEASQALTPALLIALPRAGRVVLAGDHRQLPPTVLSRDAEAGGLGRTAFEGLISGDDDGAFGHMLRVQHRMHEALMRFPSARFYDDALVADPSVAAHVLADLGVGDDEVLAPERVLDVVDTAGAGHEEERPTGSESLRNPGEAALVERLVRAAIARGLAPEQVGIITPYAAQSSFLQHALDDLLEQGLEVDSVDGFQGREKELIVLSAVRSNPSGEVGFLSDARRLNVSITRARRKLTVVGDSATLSADGLWSAFFEDAIARGGYRSCFELPEPMPAEGAVGDGG